MRKNNHLEEAVRALLAAQAKLVGLLAKAYERQAKADERTTRLEQEWLAMRREMDQTIGILNSHTKILESLPYAIQKRIRFQEPEPARHPGKEELLAALNRFDGNKLKAARSLGISRSSVYRKMKEFGL